MQKLTCATHIARTDLPARVPRTELTTRSHLAAITRSLRERQRTRRVRRESMRALNHEHGEIETSNQVATVASALQQLNTAR